MHGLLEVQGIENLDLIPVLLQRMAAGNHDVPFGIGDDEAGGIGFLPEPLPPTIRTFLFRAVFGSLGRLFIVSRSVCVRMMLFSNAGST